MCEDGCRDAPADNYFDTDDLDDDDRKQLYLELRKEAGVAARFNRSDEDVFNEEEKKVRSVGSGWIHVEG